MISVLNRRRGLMLLPFFAIIGFLIYSNTLRVPFHFDDLQNIVANPHIRLTQLTIRDLVKAGIRSNLPRRPIANISFALNYYFHQYNVAGYHVVNTIIHVLTGIFLYLLIRTTLTISSREATQLHPLIAFFAALVWLVHPIQTQSVTYIRHLSKLMLVPEGELSVTPHI